MAKKKFIGVCTPSLGMVPLEWANVFRVLMTPLNYGLVNFFTVDTKGGEIAEGRNNCVHQALASDTDDMEVTHLFWWDDDVICDPAAIMALIRHERDIASGVYFSKSEYSEPLIFPGPGGGTSPFLPGQAFETWGHGMGLTLVRIGVYRRMMEAFPDLPRDKYGRFGWYRTEGLQDAKLEGNVLWVGGTEDLYFLGNAGKMGITPLVDCSQAAFGWHLDTKAQTGYPPKQWAQRIRGEPVTWDTPGGVVTWG